MTTILAPMCYWCIRQHADKKTCDAYPEGIPDSILLSDTDHRQPWINDDGLQFEAKNAADAANVAERWSFMHPKDDGVKSWAEGWKK